MSIDGIIADVQPGKDSSDLVLYLLPRVFANGERSIVGRDKLMILGATYKPMVGQAVWGGADSVTIEPLEGEKGKRYYRRISNYELVEKEKP